MVTWIAPPQLHINIEEFCRLGIFANKTVGEPTIQGAGVTGTHGIGVKAPKAAAVAAATVGFAKLEHIPNGMILTKGLWSMILAAGLLLVITLLAGKTIRLEGAAPKLHWSMAPMQTCIPIDQPPFTSFSKLLINPACAGAACNSRPFASNLRGLPTGLPFL